MKKKLIICLFLLNNSNLLFSASDPPPTVEDYGWLAITRVATSKSYVEENKDDETGFDLGDTDEIITSRYGGKLFQFGGPLDVEIYLSLPQEGSSWDQLILEYTYSENPTSEDWITVDIITNGIEHIQGRRTVPFRHIRPTQIGTLMIRVYAITDSDTYTSIPTSSNITPKGDDISWMNREVVQVLVEPTPRPAS